VNERTSGVARPLVAKRLSFLCLETLIGECLSAWYCETHFQVLIWVSKQSIDVAVILFTDLQVYNIAHDE
jgi:hypothetical protein